MAWEAYFNDATGGLTSVTSVPRPLRAGEAKKSLGDTPPDESLVQWNPVTRLFDIDRPVPLPRDHISFDRVQRLIDKPKVQAFIGRLTPQQRKDLKDSLIEVFAPVRYDDE